MTNLDSENICRRGSRLCIRNMVLVWLVLFAYMCVCVKKTGLEHSTPFIPGRSVWGNSHFPPFSYLMPLQYLQWVYSLSKPNTNIECCLIICFLANPQRGKPQLGVTDNCQQRINCWRSRPSHIWGTWWGTPKDSWSGCVRTTHRQFCLTSGNSHLHNESLLNGSSPHCANFLLDPHEEGGISGSLCCNQEERMHSILLLRSSCMVEPSPVGCSRALPLPGVSPSLPLTIYIPTM